MFLTNPSIAIPAVIDYSTSLQKCLFTKRCVIKYTFYYQICKDF